MKNRILTYSIFFVFIFLSLNALSQNSEIISDTDEFEYLIGMEYTDVKELDTLVYQTRTSMIDANKETSSTNFTNGTYQIITSEIVRYEPETLKKIYKIQDIIVLNGSYYSCEGCLISEEKDITIKSIHQKSKVKKESILIAFEKNDLTGIYIQVDPSKYIWNKNTDRLEELKKKRTLGKF
ncbi:hypothetical protein [uncultured Dokdonia sp.]|uniref:hypothetical protein n=1 Tax=uncultured Dokdonia sp. TaxID=575653 RepID=UPI0026274EBE|nr:hypothetical protein [uncultured Dokdonia sp.]